MLASFTLLLTAALVGDPRPQLVELQMRRETPEALVLAERQIAERPEESRSIGLDYLRGHLLDQLGRPEAAAEAFVAAMTATPSLALYSRYRLALEQERMGHPEVAAGLVAGVAGAAETRGSISPLVGPAVRLLARTLSAGGDCRLLRGLRPERLPDRERRLLLLTQADCALAEGMPELARGLLVDLIEEKRNDEPARTAAERLAAILPEAERGRLPMLLGLTFHQHREFERALRFLRLALGPGEESLSAEETFETRYAAARALFWQDRFQPAAAAFAQLLPLARTPEQRARAYYQQARSLELLGAWKQASAAFRRSYLAEPNGREWAGAALISALRLEWRGTREEQAAPLYEILVSRPEFSEYAIRAALFLASSDIVRGRADRAGGWLDFAARSRDDRIETSYWRGRLFELQGAGARAVGSYLDALLVDPYHPLARSGLARLASPALAGAARAEALRRAGSAKAEDLHAAWLLLGNDDPAGRAAQRRLRTLLLADPATSPYLLLSEVPVGQWPLWKADLDRPEEQLLALGIFREGAPAIREHFPLSEPSLSFTGSLLLARGGEFERAVATAGDLGLRIPNRVPALFLPDAFRELLYPPAFRDLLETQAALRGIDPNLLSAVVRQESRFDPYALSGAGARGLGQFTLQTARRLAGELGLPPPAPDDLYRPEVSLTLSAVYLAQLLRELDGSIPAAVAAYNAGAPQARVWASYTHSKEPEEFLTKVGFRETRNYLRQVLTGYAHFSELY
jgi:soluble lytic murein transglycosylase